MSEPNRILVADDDASTRRIIAQALRQAGYFPLEAVDGREALVLIGREQPAVVVMDVGMPEIGGFEVVARMRAQGWMQPVLLLTAHGAVDFRVRGLTAGADDYVSKPFDFRELVARVQALLRRVPPAERKSEKPAGELHFGEVVVDLARKTASRAAAPLALTRTEFALLDLLSRHGDRPVPREEILEKVWGYAGKSNTRTVETHIWRLRKKLGDNGDEPRWIRNRSGLGYVLTPEVRAPMEAGCA